MKTNEILVKFAGQNNDLKNKLIKFSVAHDLLIFAAMRFLRRVQI